MADSHKLFLTYNEDLKVTKSKLRDLKKSKDALRKRIRDYFTEHHPEYNPLFYIQGSYKMGTMVKTKDDECDLDDGVYFRKKPDVTCTTLQKWIYNAVEGHTEGGQQHRKKCIRVIYAGDYHIDLPVYYKLEGEEDKNNHPYIAVKNEDWQNCDPKEFIDWFNDVKMDQMVRITRYLKGWGDYKRHNMPSGLAIAVLTARNLSKNDRDDISLRDTLLNIKRDLSNSWKCSMPTTPKDDLLSDYDDTFKSNFFEALNAFIKDADAAIDEESLEKSSKKWRNHLGKRYSIGKGTAIDEAKEIGLAEKAGSLTISVKGEKEDSQISAKSKGGSYSQDIGSYCDETC